jgi:hypothetical protein
MQDDETVEVGKRQRMNQDRIGHAEDHRVQPDANREAGDRHRRYALVLEGGSQAEADVLEQGPSLFGA